MASKYSVTNIDWTPRRKAQVLSMKGSGMTFKEIADILRVSGETVSKVYREAKIERSNQ